MTVCNRTLRGCRCPTSLLHVPIFLLSNDPTFLPLIPRASVPSRSSALPLGQICRHIRVFMTLLVSITPASVLGVSTGVILTNNLRFTCLSIMASRMISVLMCLALDVLFALRNSGNAKSCLSTFAEVARLARDKFCYAAL